MPVCDFNKVVLKLQNYPVNLLHIFRAPSRKNASGGLPLKSVIKHIDVHSMTNAIDKIEVAMNFLWLRFFFVSR